ncbi:hypothetical protein BS50DRAFT_667069 [Corynespora cassiicola Philippines]|uniref:DUF7626 domain-containing protein n=1 Tax=Corynespora cassiicola Philippines TaxID=1448308 RepID=A0A2T2NNI6_CORCC|nr:hypothetical protein BS50DRAFT_667069 [Corynespora cassiicola Philippines]
MSGNSFLLDVGDVKGDNRFNGDIADVNTDYDNMVDDNMEDGDNFPGEENNTPHLSTNEAANSNLFCCDDMMDEDMDSDYQNEASEENDNELEDSESPHKRSQPTFHDASIRRAKRSALRTQADNSESFMVTEDRQEKKATRTGTRISGSFGRRNRRKTDTLPVVYSKVSAMLDSDDELMLSMREAGHTDRQIADRLEKEGRRKYDVKTISTRVTRIRFAQAEHTNELLAQGPTLNLYLTPIPQDLLLMKAYQLADLEIRYEIERARATRFKKVATFLHRISPEGSTPFSAQACRDRYLSLVAGTAIIPASQCDDPSARAAEQAARAATLAAELAAQKAAKEQEDTEKMAFRENVVRRQAELSLEKATRREEAERVRLEKVRRRIEKQEERAKKAAENKKNKATRKKKLDAEHAARVAREGVVESGKGNEKE